MAPTTYVCCPPLASTTHHLPLPQHPPFGFGIYHLLLPLPFGFSMHMCLHSHHSPLLPTTWLCHPPLNSQLGCTPVDSSAHHSTLQCLQSEPYSSSGSKDCCVWGVVVSGDVVASPAQGSTSAIFVDSIITTSWFIVNIIHKPTMLFWFGCCRQERRFSLILVALICKFIWWTKVLYFLPNFFNIKDSANAFGFLKKQIVRFHTEFSYTWKIFISVHNPWWCKNRDV